VSVCGDIEWLPIEAIATKLIPVKFFLPWRPAELGFLLIGCEIEAGTVEHDWLS